MGVGQRAPSGRSASGLAQPNNPLELTAHSVGFVVVPGLGGCGPPLSGSVRCPRQRICYTPMDSYLRRYYYAHI